MKLGIIGFGVVGRAVAAYHEKNHDVYAYDIRMCGPENMDRINEIAEVVFVCVSTPYSKDGNGLDCSNVYDAVSKIAGSKTVVIKSTVMPGTTDRLQELHPHHRFFFVPEFLNEDTSVEDYANPRRPHIVGVPELFPKGECTEEKWFIDTPGSLGLLPYPNAELPIPNYYHILPAKQAELLKLATNSFYALKVTFANQMFDLGMTQETLDALGTDDWIYPYHLKVEHKGYRGYGGMCLVKDTRALADYAGSNDIGSLLSEVNAYNYDLLMHQNCDIGKFLGWKKQHEVVTAIGDQV